MNKEQMIERMLELAEKRGVTPTARVSNVAAIREKLNIDITVCPCDRHNLNRGCISAQCYRDILENGRCWCGAFERSK